MGVPRRTFTREFKLAAVRRLEAGVSIAEVARGLEVNPKVLHRWRREFRQGPGNAFSVQGQRRWSEGKLAELERKVGQQAMEIDLLKGCLRSIEEQRTLQASSRGPRSTGRWARKLPNTSAREYSSVGGQCICSSQLPQSTGFASCLLSRPKQLV